MSALFNRLTAQFNAGHARAMPDLLTDEHLSEVAVPTPAAVLIAVTDREEPGVLLTQRPQAMRSHPGQVAFPGGKCDPGEDAVTAALREAEEELAIPRATPRVIGSSDLYVTGTGFAVTPVLAVVPPDLPLVPNPDEVEAWFEAPLTMLLDPANWDRQELFWRGSLRSYYELHYDGFRIWGVTAAILHNLARRVEWPGDVGG